MEGLIEVSIILIFLLVGVNYSIAAVVLSGGKIVETKKYFWVALIPGMGFLLLIYVILNEIKHAAINVYENYKELK